jgi:hypothetical protein
MFEPGRLPSAERVWSWLETINGFGPRLTGSRAQQRCVDFIAAEFERIGLTVERDVRHLRRWQPERWSLAVVDGGAEELPVAYPFPYSGRTPPAGVSGALAWFERTPFRFGAAAGKIAVIEVRAAPISPLMLRLLTRRKDALPEDADLADPERTPLVSGLASCINLKRAARAGVLGVVCVWRGCADDDVAGQYLPFTSSYADCPALWVGADAGDRLRAAYQHGATVNLILEAGLDDAVPTETIYAVLPGTDSSETIIVNSHSDGPNAAEENGAVGILSLAHYFAGLPREARRRTIVFAVVTGHFQLPQLGNGGQATKAWLDQHPELWDGAPGHRRAVAGLTMEHLGCREWKEDEAGLRYGPTGRVERELVYATNPTMQAIYREAVQGRRKLRSLVVEPRNGFFFGEAEPLFDAGIPSISLCPLPNYLCALSANGGIDRLDPELMYEQIGSFARALLRLDATSTAEIGGVVSRWTDAIGRIIKFRLVAAI